MRRLIAATIVAGLAATACNHATEEVPTEHGLPAQNVAPTLEEARRLADDGDLSAAASKLEEIVSAHATDRDVDEAELLLGRIRLQQRRHVDAVAALKSAASGSVAPEYAKMLFVRAVVDGNLAQFQEEALGIARDLPAQLDPETKPLLAEELSTHVVELLLARGRLAEGAEAGRSHLRAWPTGKRSDSVRWMTADALDRLGDQAGAFELYDSIWHDTPSSPWAARANERLEALASRGIGRPRALTADARVAFASSLQRAGLHESAVRECNLALADAPAGEAAESALVALARSLRDLRRNRECAAAADRLRTMSPSSRHLPDAALAAVGALRRTKATGEIQEWARVVQARFPRDERTAQILYDVATYCMSEVSRAEGEQRLEALVASAPAGPLADDALWKLAWARRNAGDTAGAVSRLSAILTEHPKSGFRKAALYWYGRFIAESDRAKAVESWQSLLREAPNDYYGHHAAEELLNLGVRDSTMGNGMAFPPIDSFDDPSRHPDWPHYPTAVHLARLGLDDFAADELRAIPQAAAEPSMQFVLARLLARSGRPAEARKILRAQFEDFLTAGSRDPSLVPPEFWHACYPFNHRTTIVRTLADSRLAGTQLDEYLVASLIRMESGFEPDAVSPVGAIGLMQLMPATAGRIASDRGLAPPTREDLFDPDVNIHYGVDELGRLVHRFGGDWFPAICAYNAGEEAVSGWWEKARPDVKQDEFIENIPYSDTRLYIKQILGDYRNYQWIYGQSSD